MFSFSLPYRSAVRRRLMWRNVFALFVMFCLSATLLFTGCKTDSNDDEKYSLNGTWVYNSDYGSEKYIIDTNAKTLEYEGNFKGKIHETTYFTSSSGVIIIEYDVDGKPEYWDYSNFPEVEGPYPPLGDFLGIYFINLSATSVQLANASDATYTDSYYRCEAASLNEAKTKFTADNVDLFIFDWSYVQPQVKQ
jgi:hypothetical protein